MPKRKKPSRRKSRQKARRRRKPHPNGTAVLVLDQQPFIKKALTTCRRLRTELRKKQQQLSQFEEVEMNAYNSWISRSFGSELTRVRELEDKVADLQFITEQLHLCELCLPDKVPEVYEELFRRKKEGTLHFFVPPKPDEEDGFEEEDKIDDLDGDFESFFDEVFGNEEGDYEDEFESFGRRRNPYQNPAEQAPTFTGRIKALYRILAKRLHPDHSDLEESLRERRWHELQSAYLEADFNGLQRIEAVCDMDEGGLTLSLGLARLQDLAAYHQSHLRPIRFALRAAKRHPAFGFKETNTESLAKEIRQDFKAIQRDLRYRLKSLQQLADEIHADALRFLNRGPDPDEDPFETLFEDIFSDPKPPPTKKPPRKDARQMEFF